MKKQKKAKGKEDSYNVYSFRFNDETYQLLKKQKDQSGMSWNRFIYYLIKKS